MMGFKKKIRLMRIQFSVDYSKFMYNSLCLLMLTDPQWSEAMVSTEGPEADDAYEGSHQTGTVSQF